MIEDRAYLEAFILGMHEYAAGSSDAVAAAIELEGAELLLDVGGGGGTYSIACCRKYPDLSAVILDQPPVLEIAANVAAASGLSDRISVRADDYRTADFRLGA